MHGYVRSRIVSSLQRIAPGFLYWAVSCYHPVKAYFFLKKYPGMVTGGPCIVLVAGEDGPDKLSVYAPVYAVYKTLRQHFHVHLSVHASFNERHARRIAQMKPDLVLLSFDSGVFQQIFERCRIPLMGSDSETCMTCYDKVKVKAKEIVRKQGIATMPWMLVRKGESLQEILEKMDFPLVIKPRHAGSSKGLSKVASPKELEKAIRKALKWDKEAIAEPYISGREYTCTVYGNENPQTLPLNRKIMRFEREELEARGEKILKSRYPVICDEPFVEEIHELSKRIYVIFHCRDMIRIDWKYDDTARVLYFIEVNILPWIGRNGGNIEDCVRAAGSSYDEFIINLFKDALRRNGRTHKESLKRTEEQRTALL